MDTTQSLPVLSISDLRVELCAGQQTTTVLDGVDLEVARGETLCLVGESGSGKSITAMSVMRLLAHELSVVESGEIFLEGRNLLALPPQTVRSLRGSTMAIVFQEPMVALNPVLRIGRQLSQALRYHDRSISRAEAAKQATSALGEVGIADPAAAMTRYPHQMSGGTRQRVMIAMALLARPSLLVADEPTTALDVTTQAQVLELIKRLQAANGMAVLLITHDMAVAAQVADRVAVMYAGRIVESGPVELMLERPLHPYTQGLLASVPTLDGPRQPRLQTIPGSVPRPGSHLSSCAFAPRCPLATDQCRTNRPPFTGTGTGNHGVACWHAKVKAA